MEDSIFTKIVRGDIPSHKVYEDDATLAFLNIYPSVTGHTLVIPKVQVDSLWDLTEADYTAVMNTTKKVAKQLRTELGVPRVGVKVVGVDVPHAHVHLIPFETADEFNQNETIAEPDHAALAALAERLYFS